MTDREKLIELIGQVQYLGGLELALADHLISHGVTITQAVPGPSVDDPNIMELCFHNGERHMKEKVGKELTRLAEHMPCITLAQALAMLEGL
jgi:hypothetical protein